MMKQQWTVAGLLVLLLGLEIVRSQAVRNFFSFFQTAPGFASLFNMTLQNPTDTIPIVNAPGSSSFQQQQATQKVRGIANA